MKHKQTELNNTLSLPAEENNLQRFISYVLQMAQDANISLAQANKLELALEELLLNVMKYAYADSQQENWLQIGCNVCDRNLFCVYILDQGRPFNPLQAKEPDLSKDIQERPLGGLGIHLIKNMFEHLEYKRENGKNILKICLKLNLED